MAYDTQQTHVVTAFYDTRSGADDAVDALTTAGIDRSAIDVVEGNDPDAAVETQREEKGFFESIGDFLVGDDDRTVYAEGLRRGGYLVTARVSEAHYDLALEILDTDHAVDLDSRSSAWRDEGWTGMTSTGGMTDTMDMPGAQDSNESTRTGMTGMRTADTTGDGTADRGQPTGQSDDNTIQVLREDVRIGKRDVSHGRIRVRSWVVEDQVSEDVTLHSETVEIDRRPVDRVVEGGVDAFRDRTIEVEETAQEAVVSKEARVVEEIDIRRHSDDRTETVTGTVRHTEVEVDDDRTASKTR